MGVLKFAVALAVFTLLHKGDAIKCYVCDSETARHCGKYNTPNDSFLKEAGKKGACYELSKIDRKTGKITVERGIVSTDPKILEICFQGRDGTPTRTTSIVPLARPRISSNRKPNTLSEEAWNNLQESKILSKRSASNPNMLLKEESEGDESTINNPDYNCTTCIKSNCNWKLNSVDYIDLDSFVTPSVDEELDVNMIVSTTEIYDNKGGISSPCSYTYFSLHFLLVIITIGLI